MTNTVAIVSGYFNPLHVGHVRMMKAAKQLGDTANRASSLTRVIGPCATGNAVPRVRASGEFSVNTSAAVCDDTASYTA
ncbi:adenylyltransferase/cytidyltransferase family protein [Kibdelosporangium philippinense]